MSAFDDAGAPLEPDFVEPKLAKGRAVLCEGEERRPDIMEVARERGFERIKSPAGAWLSFEDAHAPAGLGQRQRRRQPVRPGTNHNRVIHQGAETVVSFAHQPHAQAWGCCLRLPNPHACARGWCERVVVS